MLTFTNRGAVLPAQGFARGLGLGLGSGLAASAVVGTRSGAIAAGSVAPVGDAAPPGDAAIDAAHPVSRPMAATDAMAQRPARRALVTWRF